MLQIENLHKSFGNRQIFDGFNLYIDRGDKIGLIAANGSGKTTLFRILIGEEDYQEGKITTISDCKIRYLAQKNELVQGKSILENVMGQESELTNLIREYEKAIKSSDTDEINRLIPLMDSMNAWDYDLRLKTILSALGIEELDRKVDNLSGGEIKRIALASALVDDADILLLDEPSNHLDLKTIEWLEDYLSNSNRTLIMTTHDRYFLDQVCNSIVEIDECKAFKYKGNYEYYLEKREERYEAKAQEMDKARNLFRQEREWISRQPKARGTKAKYRIDAFDELKKKLDNKFSRKDIDLSSASSSYLGNKIFDLENLCLSFGEKKILQNFTYSFARGEKIGIVGESGVGKTSFIRLLLGEIMSDSGKIERGETLRIAYYKQEMPSFDGEKRVIDIIRDIADNIKLGDNDKASISPTALLSQFLFDAEKQYNKVAKLSGGELRRLYLCTVLIQRPNFLILDEPTNDLDIMTLNALEEYLLSFAGSVIIVSHDRYFMDKMVDHIFVFEGDGKIKDFPGNYSTYRIWNAEQNSSERKPSEEQKSDEEKNKGRYDKERSKKLSYKEQKELERLQKEIETLEKEKQAIEQELSNPSLSVDEINKKAIRLGEVDEALDEAVLSLLELEDKVS